MAEVVSTAAETTREPSPSAQPTGGGGVVGAPRLRLRTVQQVHVHEILDEGLPLTLVRGPAGAGKTTAVAQWVAQRDLHGVWVNLDRGGEDRWSFWRSIARAFALCGHTAPHEAVERWSVVDGEPAADTIIAGFAGLTADTVMIIDDFAALTDDAVLEDLVALLTATDRLRIVGITRVRSLLESAALQVNVDTCTISPRQLNFDIDNIAAYAEHCGVELDPMDAAMILELTGGLPIGVRTAVRALTDGDERASGARSVRVRDRVVTALDEVTLRHLIGNVDDRVLELLLTCAPASSFDVVLAERLSGWADVAELLNLAERAGLGVWRQTEITRFSISGVVRDALLREVERRDPDVVRQARGIYAWWLVEQGQPLLGLREALSTRDVQLAERITRRSWVAVLSAAGQVATLIEGFSVRELHRAPALVLLAALGLNSQEGGRWRAVELFSAVIVGAQLQRKTADPVDRAALRAIESIGLRLISRSEKAAQVAKAAAQMIDELSTEDIEELGTVLPILMSHLGLSMLYGGHPFDALELFRRADATAARAGVHDIHHGAALEAGTLAMLGDVRLATDLAAEAERRHWAVRHDTGYARAFLEVAHATAALEKFDTRGVEKHLARLDEHLSTIEHWVVIETLRAAAVLLEGAPAVATEMLDRAVQSRADREASTILGGDLLARTQFLLALAQGDAYVAREIIAKPDRRWDWADDAAALIELVEGNPAAALRHLGKAAGRGRHRYGRAIEHDLLTAVALARLGRDVEAARLIERAAAAMLTTGLRFPLVELPYGALDELRALVAEASPTSSARRLFAEPPPPFELPDLAGRIALSEREIVVLRELAQTRSTAEIAARLFVSVNTVKSQLRSLYRKLDVSSREEALAIGLAQRLFRPEDGV